MWELCPMGSHPTPSSMNPLGCCCRQTLYCVWDLSIPHERPQSMDLIWLFLAGNLTQKPWQICRKLVIHVPNERVNLSPHKALPEASARAPGPALRALVGRRRNISVQRDSGTRAKQPTACLGLCFRGNPGPSVEPATARAGRQGPQSWVPGPMQPGSRSPQC